MRISLRFSRISKEELHLTLIRNRMKQKVVQNEQVLAASLFQMLLVLLVVRSL